MSQVLTREYLCAIKAANTERNTTQHTQQTARSARDPHLLYTTFVIFPLFSHFHIAAPL
jgi:hypothetical protein